MVLIACSCFLIFSILYTCPIIPSSTKFEYYDSEVGDDYYDEYITKLYENDYTEKKRNLGGYYSSEYYESEEYSNPEGNFNKTLDST